MKIDYQGKLEPKLFTHLKTGEVFRPVSQPYLYMKASKCEINAIRLDSGECSWIHYNEPVVVYRDAKLIPGEAA